MTLEELQNSWNNLPEGQRGYGYRGTCECGHDDIVHYPNSEGDTCLNTFCFCRGFKKEKKNKKEV